MSESTSAKKSNEQSMQEQKFAKAMSKELMAMQERLYFVPFKSNNVTKAEVEKRTNRLPRVNSRVKHLGRWYLVSDLKEQRNEVGEFEIAVFGIDIRKMNKTIGKIQYETKQ